MKTTWLQIRISEELKAELVELANKQGKSISEFVLDLVKYEIKKEKEKD